MSRSTIKAEVWRYNPSTDPAPRFEKYDVPFQEGLSVSNVLEYVNENHDGGLAFYLSCRRGICGGCAVRVNGKVVLACTELVRDDVKIEPVDPDKVVKDLVAG